MEIITKEVSVKTRRRCEMIDITDVVNKHLNLSKIQNGDVIVFCPHTTGAITINENADPDVVHDMLETLEKLVPKSNPAYRHNEGNSDSHVKSSMFGASEQILVSDGKCVLGTWQGIYFCEFDGPRSRKVIIQIRGSK